MDPVRSYRDLIVWKKGIEFVQSIYVLSRSFPHSESFSLTNQIRRAAVSVPSNIAEGQQRCNGNEFRHFLHISLGSLAEVDTQLVLAIKLGYLAEGDVAEVQLQIEEIRKMLYGLLSGLGNMGAKRAVKGRKPER